MAKKNQPASFESILGENKSIKLETQTQEIKTPKDETVKIEAKPLESMDTKRFTLNVPVSLLDSLNDYRFSERKNSLTEVVLEAIYEKLERYNQQKKAR